jgi:hypothetical protein
MPGESCLFSTGEEHIGGGVDSSMGDTTFSAIVVGRFSSTMGMLFPAVRFASS